MEIGQPQKELFLHIVNFTGCDYSMPVFPQRVGTLVTSKSCFWFMSEDMTGQADSSQAHV